MKKRILSAFMALALCLTLLPAAALAEGAEITESGAAQIGEKTYPTLPEAVNAAQDGDTVKLLADYETVEGAGEEEDVGLTITKSVTLDLNGHEMDDFRVAQVNDAGETLPSGNLTVADTSAAKTGKVTGMIKLLAGKLTINGGTIGDSRDGVWIEKGNLIVNGGTMDFLYGSDSGTVTITGGTVKNAQFGKGFEITVTGGSGHTGLWNVMEGTWSISDGEFEGVTFLTESQAENLHITGGTFGKITRQILRNGIEEPAPISGLLADGYAFYQKTTGNEEYNQYVKLDDTITSLENVQVKGHTHSFVNGVCTVCGNACPHTNMDGNGFCPDCNTQMAAKVEVGDTVTYSADFKEAMKNATNGTKITLLADVSIPQRTGISGDNTTVTLDLNEHKITSGWLDIGNAKSPTSCTLKIIGKGSYEPPLYGGIITVNMKATLDLSEWEGGTISTINISDNSNYAAETREAAVIVGPKAGTIGKLTFGNNQLDELKKTKLSGGSFNEIWVADFGPVKLGELLADGYAFQNGDGSYVEYGTTLQDASIYNVKVVKCLHPNMKPDAITGIATCEYCGKSGKFVASVDGNLYTDMNEAISYWLENGGTLKLFDDYTAANGTWRIGSGSHTINLNGHMMSVRDDSAFKPTNNMHLTVTDGTERGQIENILLDGSQGGSFTLESGYVGNLGMTGGAVVALKGGSVDKLDVQNCSANTNLSIQGGSIGELNIKDWADDMHVSATSGSLGAYSLPSDKILADVLDHQYYATGTSLDRQVDTAQPVGKFVIRKAPYDFGSTSKTAEVPMNGSIPFMVDSPSENVGVYDVKWYRRTNSGAEHMVGNRVADVKVGDALDVFCVITGLDRPNGEMKWQVAVKDYTLKTLPPSLENAEITFAPGWQEKMFWPDPDNHSVGKIEIPSGQNLYTVTLNGKTLTEGTDYRVISGNIATGIGTYDFTIEGIAPNYSGTKKAQWTVVPYPLGAFKSNPIKKQYDGTVALPDGVFPGCFAPRSPYLPDITLREETDYVVTDARFDTPDASNENKAYRYTVELKNPNYVFANGTKVHTWVYGVDINATIEITQANAPAARESALEVINDHADTYTVDLAALLPKLESPKTYGEITYGRPAVWLDSGYYTAGNAKVENGKLILTIDKNPVTTTGSIGTVTVKVSSTNYHDFPLTINVNAANKSVPFSGDSNPTVKSETTTNPDGSVTKTETKSDGTVIETTTEKDGSVTKTETKKDGGSVTEIKTPNGSTGTVKTDKNGKTEASVNISSKAAEEAKTTGNAVQIPAAVTSSRDSNTAPTVKIILPTGSGETKIEIPVSNRTSGTVAVLVHPDGTEEIVKSSIPTETGIQLTVTGSTTLKIIDNTKPFQDINGHWAENSIDFVGARELFMGTGTNTFSPDVDMSRAQLWTVLARQGNADLSGGSNWYEKSQLWAVDKGISDGTNPQDSISRAQMISMLWRTAGSPGTTDSPRFTDVPADAYYTDAVAWAAKNNITSGVGNGKFDPNASCTRAQIATFLRNAYENDIF